VPPTPEDLFLLAEAYLAEVADALDTILDFDPTLEGAPERQFVSPGQPVMDFVGRDCCSQIAVFAQPVIEGDTTPGGFEAGRRSMRFAWKNEVSLSAVVSRCIPTGESSNTGVFRPPSAASLTASSRQHLLDLWVLWNYLHQSVHSERLLEHCDEVRFDGAIPAIPQGGCAGVVVNLTASLGGYIEEIGS